MKVLLAIDEEPCSEAAVAEVGTRKWEEGTTVRVLHAVGKFVPPAQELWYDAGGDLNRTREIIKDRSEMLAEEVVDWLRQRGITAEAVVRDGEPGKAIVAEAKEWEADLIVVGSRGHTGIRRMLEGSVSHYVVDHAPCPVEVVHVKQEREKKMGDKRRVLILCTGNSARSQMAEGILRHDGDGLFEVESAGVNPSQVRPEAIEAMREIGIDISGHRSKAAEEFVGQDFDYIITVCDNARETCPFFPGHAERIHQSFEDPPPPGAVDHDSSMTIFRRVRDEIREWMAGFIKEHSEERKEIA